MSKDARMAGTRAVVAELCALWGVTLTPETPVETEHLGKTCFAYVGSEPYSVIARHEDRGTETVLYVGAGMLPADLSAAGTS